jgi:Spy/CpxP family protein refolding chaperone
MKKIVMVSVVLSAAFALTTASFAQTAGPSGGAPAAGFVGKKGGGALQILKINKDILAKLNLTAEQQGKIEELDKKLRKDVGALRKEQKAQGANVDKDAMKQKRADLMKEYREGLLAILTDSQQEQYKTMFRAEMKKLKEEREAAAAPATKN